LKWPFWFDIVRLLKDTWWGSVVRIHSCLPELI